MKRIIINGANGYVASHFVNDLLILGYDVTALVRGNHEKSADERMNHALTGINESDHFNNEKLKVYNYSLLEEDFALPQEQMREIFQGEVDYFHFAASLKYDLKSKDEIFETNIRGIENSLNVFLKYSAKRARFFMISTAYSCGNLTSPFREKFYEDEDISGFRNYYEQSKRVAENVVKKYMEENNLNAHILRLSQVVGNNKTGVTKTDYGIFDFTKRVLNLAHRYPDKTVRVRVDPDSTQNLIPIDTAIGYLSKVVEISDLPIIMNLTARTSVKNKLIANSLSKLIPITLIPDKYLKQGDMNALERIVSIGMSFTGRYADIDIQFETKNLDILGLADDNEPTEQTVFRMLEYFVSQLPKKRNNNVYTPAS